MDLTDAVKSVEVHAAENAPAEWIADQIRSQSDFGPSDLGPLLEALEARITQLAEGARTRPDHAKLNRGLDTMRRVAQLLAPSGAEAELKELAARIRVCVTKSDNYAATAGKYLRQARERCREIGMDFSKWCAQANLGIKRSRIYQLMGPDPIAASRRDENHNVKPENVHSMDVAQFPNVEPPAEPPPAEHADPFDAELAQFETWFIGLNVVQQQEVVDIVTRVRESPRKAA